MVNRDELHLRSSDNVGVKPVRVSTLTDCLISGAVSSGLTTIIYQPLELLKTRIQLQTSSEPSPYLGRLIRSTKEIVRDHNFAYLWRGTGASLLRSVPGIGLYYASLQVLQSNLSEQGHKPDNPLQAFCFGLAARSMISFALLPITVVKVRYESGLYKYSNLPSAVRDAYFKTGWIGGSPTILRDSLFSGIYYMCYTKLRLINRGRVESSINEEGCWNASDPLLNFTFGLISGLLASLITNPIDVLKTNMQVNRTGNISMKETVAIMLRDGRGYTRFFDGIFPRSLRRTLVAATTWTFYELFLDTLKKETC